MQCEGLFQCSGHDEDLHGRPHWFVRHCITRIRNVADLDPDSVIQMTSDAFQVPRQYTVRHRAT